MTQNTFSPIPPGCPGPPTLAECLATHPPALPVHPSASDNDHYQTLGPLISLGFSCVSAVLRMLSSICGVVDRL